MCQSPAIAPSLSRLYCIHCVEAEGDPHLRYPGCGLWGLIFCHSTGISALHATTRVVS